MTKTNFLRGMTLAIICATSMLFAQVRDFAFPSPLPPHGNAADVKQIVSIIWDDNAYSGKSGTNYEGSNWVGTFATQSWVGGMRLEGNWNASGGASAQNPDGLQEGDFGMAWAIKTLSGHPAERAMRWHRSIDYPQGREVIWDGWVWRSRTWTGNGIVPTHQPNADPWQPGWDRVRQVGAAAPTKTNPDGTPITMTFNVISGFFVPIERGITGENGWTNQISKFGYFVPNDEFYPVGTPQAERHSRVAVAWGREMAIFNPGWGAQTQTGANENDQRLVVMGYINHIFEETALLGHEIGNHTIDHMETNSVLPHSRGNVSAAYPASGGRFQGEAYRDGFGRWGGDGMTQGGRYCRMEFPDGQTRQVDQVTHFGQREGNAWQYMGWQVDAGRILSVRGWQGLIELGREQIHEYISPNQGNRGFRAPRLEVNSNLFHALKNLNYWYDTGNEEGYEYNVDGTNFMWPYTMDNGSPNMAWQRMVGSNRSNWDSLPSGLWQYPVSVFIVPENHRATLWNNYVAITTGAADGTTPTEADRLHFLRVGKVTGFDFNLFILKGATREIATATMRHSLDQRMRGGKAPFQVGAHTDYFTPIYDNATLLNTLNRPSYGLNVSRGWNTWKDRVAVFEDFVTYGLSRGAHFMSGEKTIEYMRELTSRVRVGAEKRVIDNARWQFFSHSKKSTLDGGNLATGADITTVQDASARDLEITGFAVYGNAGDFVFDHISLEYSTTAPITIRLITNNPIDQSFPYEVTLSNLNGFNNWDGSRAVNKNRFVNSREIPLSAFQRNQYVGAPEETRPEIRNWIGLKSPSTEFARTITGIEISVQVPLVNSFQWRSSSTPGIMNRVQNQRNWVAVRNFTLHSGEQVPPQQVGVTPVATKGAQRIAIMGMTNNSLKLNMVHSGTYNVDVVSVNGRVVKSFKDVNLNMGVNTLPLNNLSKGMYMIRIRNNQVNTTLKSLVI